MVTNGLKSLKDLYLQAKNHGGYIHDVTLPYNIERYFVFCLILRGENAVLISLITKNRIMSNYVT